jgi:outer membrane protein assembly factor BamA
LLPRLFPAVLLVLMTSLLPRASAQGSFLSSRTAATDTAIREVSFENVTALFSEDQQKLIQMLHEKDRDWVTSQSPAQLSNFIEGHVLALYQDRGYWRAKVSAKVTWVRGTGVQRQVDALITALNEGEQYWLKEIRWSGVNAFPERDLIKTIGLRPWDLVSRAKLSSGLEAVRKLYASRGYIAFSATPQTLFDEASHSLTLQIEVHEEGPFHFGTLSIEGLDYGSSRKLQQVWQQMHEQPYSLEKLRGFFEKFVPGMPPGADPLDYSNSSMDLDNHTVDIFLSFLPAQAEKRE